MNSKSLAIAAFTIALAPLQADFSYQETTKITGGSLTKMMKFIPGGGKTLEPKTSYVYVKGDRLAHVFPDSMSITDLSNETITQVDLEKKTYSTITFAEMRAAMEKMAERMKGKNAPDAPQMEMTMSVKGTGQSRQFSGMSAREYIMLIGLNAKQAQNGASPVGLSEIETDMWMTPKIAGYAEVQDFYLRMGKKIGWSPNMNPLLMQQPGSGEAMKKAAEEMAKLDGTPVMTITKVKGTSPMAAMMGQPRPSGGNSSAESSSERPRFGGGLAGMAAGGIMGRRNKNKEAQKADETASAAPSSSDAGDGVMMEMQSESSGFSSAAIPAGKLDVPAGFQQVEHPMKKALDKK